MAATTGKPDEQEASGQEPRASSLMDTVRDESDLPDRARRADAAAAKASGSARIFGKYRLLAELGRGGMADVHLAVSVGPAGFSKLQVIKRLRPGMTDEAEMRSMMLDEARLAARLNHKNIVQTNEVGIVDDQYFLSMEYLDGQPYHRILKRASQLGRTIPLPFAVKILCEVLSGLHYAHEARDYDGVSLGVVHRDVSPQNLFVTYDGQVKVVDFGIAKSTGRLVETQTGIIRGKITYMAPEQAFANEVDRRADIFSVGVLLWEAVAGERLWGNMSDPEIVARLMHDIPSVTTVRADAPADLARLCDRALSRDPDKRPATAAEMRSELEEYLALHDIQVSAEALGALVVDLFAEEREELGRLVDRELALLRAGEDLERSDIARVKRITEASGIRKNLATGGIPGPVALPGAMRIPGSSGAPRIPTGRFGPVPESRDAVSSGDMRGSGSARAATPPPPPDSVSGPTIPRAPAFDADERMTARELSPPASVLSTAPGPPSSVTVPAAHWGASRPKWRHPVVYLAAMAVAATAAVFVAKSSLGPAGPAAGASDSASAPTAALTAPPSASATAAPSAAPLAAQPGGNLIHLRINTNPSGTRILVDGTPLPTGPGPFDGKLVKDGAVHRITVEATGFYPQSKMIVFDRDQTLEFILHSKKGGLPPPKDNPYR
jgi:serine/threonine-protein kinase